MPRRWLAWWGRLLSLATDTVDGGTCVYLVDCSALDPAPLWGALRDRPVVGIHAVDLVWGLGTLHCLTQQEPAV